MTTAPPTLLTINPLASAPGLAPVVVGLIDHSTYGPVGGSGGWQVIDRPKTFAATQWYDRAPFQLEFDCMLDNGVTQGPKSAGTSVEADCNQLQSWLDAVTGTYEPTTLSITGPVPGSVGTNGVKTFILFSISFSDAIRDFTTGDRILQKVHIVLYEYNKPIASLFDTTPAATAKAKAPAPAATVKFTAKQTPKSVLIPPKYPKTKTLTSTVTVKGKKVTTTKTISYVDAFYIKNKINASTKIVAGKAYLLP